MNVAVNENTKSDSEYLLEVLADYAERRWGIYRRLESYTALELRVYASIQITAGSPVIAIAQNENHGWMELIISWGDNEIVFDFGTKFPRRINRSFLDQAFDELQYKMTLPQVLIVDNDPELEGVPF